MVKLRKIASLESEPRHLEEAPNKDLKRYSKSLGKKWETKEGVSLYEHTGKILAVKNEHTVRHLLDSVYFMKFGEQI